MRSRIKRHKVLAVGLASLGVAGLAWASPWDIDMVDSRMVKAYEWKMRPVVPEGSVQRPNGAISRPSPTGSYQNDYEPAYDRFVDGDKLTNPFAAATDQVARGERLFAINCQPCHGPQGKGGGPVTDTTQKRFPVPAPVLSGAGNISSFRSDGYIYLTIRNGGAVMPAQGLSLTDSERWAVVSYIRSLEGTAYAPPAPAGGQ